MANVYAVLLAAVNVGKRKVPMADLRTLLAELGYTQVRTYLASGNAVLTADEDEDAVAAKVSAALEERFGFQVACLVRGHGYLSAVAAACPFPADEVEGKHLHAVFYSAPVGQDRYADIDQQAFLPEEFRLGDRVMYLHLPDGAGRSALSAALTKPAKRLAGITATGRNWNTVKALLEWTAPPTGTP
jgi:uncharacterized protein (DUF1697 family)